MFPFTETTITDPKRLEHELGKIVERGYSESEGEETLGMRGIAAPIFSLAGRVGTSVPEYRGVGEMRQRLIDLLVQAAKEITKEIALFCREGARGQIQLPKKGGEDDGKSDHLGTRRRRADHEGKART